MRIVCPKCDTEYALDAAQLAADGTPVQCSACEHTFTAFPTGKTESSGTGDTSTAAMPAAQGSNASTPPGDEKSATEPGAAVPRDPTPPAHPTADIEPPDVSRSPESSTPSRRPGKARAQSAAMGRGGDLSIPPKDAGGVNPPPPPLKAGGGRLFLAQGDRIYKVKDIATLQRWVVEKRVLPADRLSRDGKSWDVVSSVAELRPFFTVLDQLKQTKRALSKSRKATSEAKKLRRLSTPGVPVPQRRQPPPPVLPADRPAHLPPGSESLAAQERAVVSLSDDVSAGATTPVGLEDLQTAEARRLAAMERLEGSTPPAVPSDGATPSLDEPGAPDRAGTSPVPEQAPDPGTPSEEKEAAAAAPTAPGSSAASGKASPASDDSRAVATVEDLPDSDDDLADSFFGAGMESDDGVPDPFDVGTAPDGFVPSGARVTRSFTTPGTVESSDQLPMPESIQVPTQDAPGDFDPDQTFDGLKTVRPNEGVGAPFWGFVLLLLAVGVVAGWYFLMGPGRTSVFGDPTAGLTPPPTAEEAAESTTDGATPEDEPSADEGGSAEGADGDAVADAAGDETPQPTPEPTPVPVAEPTPEPTPEPVAEPARSAEPETPAPVKKAAPTRSASALRKAGDRARDRGDFRGAAEAYRAAVELKPGDANTHIELGWSYIELGKNSDASTHFQRATSLRPNAPEAHYGLGLAYQSMGRNQQAATEYRKVIELDPNGRDTLEVRALLRQLE
ncbi:MAG: zinc-ribbon domain-containing protein [Deltaproteobacteria bacterium]|nr:zinc-ribbon domain-containing protein [Deltaproteobacteria bacterium]